MLYFYKHYNIDCKLICCVCFPQHRGNMEQLHHLGFSFVNFKIRKNNKHRCVIHRDFGNGYLGKGVVLVFFLRINN